MSNVPHATETRGRDVTSPALLAASTTFSVEGVSE